MPPPITLIPVPDPVHLGPNVTAYIHDIDHYGLMEIRFNATMFTNFNLSQLNTDLLEIHLDPSYELPEGFNMSDLNFTWEAISYKNTEMYGKNWAILKIKINWNNVAAISPFRN